MDGEKLREIRTQRGLSQRELGEAVGTHQTTISKIERLDWEPAGAMASSIARVLSVAPGDLAGNGSCVAPKPIQRRSASAGSEPSRRMPPTHGLAPRDDPRVEHTLSELRRGCRPAPPVPRAPTYYRCPYCDANTHTEEDAVRHAVACDPKFPGYSEVRVRYVDLSDAEQARRRLRDASRTRAASGSA